MEVVALLERQRHRATALEVSLHTGWTVEDSEEALSRLMVDVRGTFEISGEDGRVLYLLPWEGSTVAGTTDRPGDITFEPKATKEEVEAYRAKYEVALCDLYFRNAPKFYQEGTYEPELEVWPRDCPDYKKKD